MTAPTQLLLDTSGLAPGDFLMMTCAIRDLHLQFPGEYVTEVNTRCRDIWRHNPHLSTTTIKQREHFTIGYSASINSSNQRKAHFATGFVQHLSEKLGRRVLLSDLKPDVHLTEAEEDPKNAPVRGDYWLVVSGGKSDYPAKIWDPAYFQAVVDLLPDIRFVQVGSKEKGHRHYKLARARNMVGKTSFRDLMLLCRHARGILCGVTCTMHLAAAFNRPCVVLGGGREAWWWEAYTRETWKANAINPVPADFVDHTFFHTLGQLDCCSKHGCWRSRAEPTGKGKRCDLPVKGPTIWQPTCLTLITPERVAAAITNYENGILPLAEKLPGHLKEPLFRGELKVSGRVKKRATAPKPATPALSVTITQAAPQRFVESRVEDRLPVSVCLYVTETDRSQVARAIDSLRLSNSPEAYKFIVVANGVSRSVQDVLHERLGKYGAPIRTFPKRLDRYEVMRQVLPTLKTVYGLWFPGSAQVTSGDWLVRALAMMKSKDVVLAGFKTFCPLTKRVASAAKASNWYAYKSSREHGSSPSVVTVNDQLFFFKTEFIAGDWPREGLDPSEQQVLLGEMANQKGGSVGGFTYGLEQTKSQSHHAGRGSKPCQSAGDRRKTARV